MEPCPLICEEPESALEFGEEENISSSKKCFGDIRWLEQPHKPASICDMKPCWTAPAPVWQRLPGELHSISQAIETSRSILELKENWDGEGALPFSRKVWETAVTFLAIQAKEALDRLGVVVDAPRILASAEGSIDLHWKTDSYELLVNIPQNGALASYYGDNTLGNMPIKATCDASKPDRKLISWLSLFL